MYFTALEFIQARTLKSQYLKKANAADIAYLTINFYFIIDLFTEVMSSETAMILSIAQDVLLGIVLINWLRVFEATVIYIRLIQQTVIDVLAFFLLYLVVTGIFSFAVLIMNLRRTTANSLYDDEISTSTLFNAFLSQYLLTLGEFNFDSYTKAYDPNSGLDWSFFLAATFFG